MINVTKAVIPVAGRGVRMLPASSTVSKCMFPIVDKPVVHYVVEEAIDSGIDEIVLVLGSNREAIQKYFTDPALTHHQYFKNRCEIRFVIQGNPNGLGSAVKCARNEIGTVPFAVLLGDTILRANKPAISQLIQYSRSDSAAVLGVEIVEDAIVHRYGIIAGNQITDRLLSVKLLIEKPTLEKAPSNLAIAARYVLDQHIFEVLDKTTFDQNGELQLTHALQLLLESNPIHAYRIEGQRFDIGNKLDFIKTNVALALEDAENKDVFRDWMQSMLAKAD